MLLLFKSDKSFIFSAAFGVLLTVLSALSAVFGVLLTVLGALFFCAVVYASFVLGVIIPDLGIISWLALLLPNSDGIFILSAVFGVLLTVLGASLLCGLIVSELCEIFLSVKCVVFG